MSAYGVFLFPHHAKTASHSEGTCVKGIITAPLVYLEARVVTAVLAHILDLTKAHPRYGWRKFALDLNAWV